MVSSRSKTVAEVAANRRTTRSKSGGVGLTPLPSPDTKQVTTRPSASKRSTSKAKANSRKKDEVFCVCKGGDDGSPMIKCEGGCKNWYHFRCIDLTEDDAGEIEKYVCPDCEAKTGLKTILDYEGADAMVEDVPPSQTETTESQLVKAPDVKEVAEDKEEIESVEESGGDGSDDDFTEESVRKKARSGKRITRRLSFSDKSDSDSDVSDDGGISSRRKGRGTRAKRVKKAAASKSPAPESSATALKRRSSSTQQNAPKRARTSEVRESANDDPVRKYCISKLEEIIKPMFFEYPASNVEDAEEAKAEEENKPKKVDDFTDEEKEHISQKVSQFVSELERCMMDTYAEPDKTGKPSAGGKYKERFRMLSFNLPKPDRIQLRQGIASGRITPAQLNVMSSTDLADEHLKHEIEIAEKEALQHSILQKITAPRAKITHKGLETIEDVSGQQRAADALREEEEERRMEMEKRERERLSRLRQRSQSEAPATPVEPSPSSAAQPPMSPTQGKSVSWGAPPPLPTHVLPGQGQDENVPLVSPVSGTRPSSRSMFPQLGNDYLSSMEDGLNLSDLINIDEEEPSSEHVPAAQTSISVVSDVSSATATPEVTTPSGPSPFTTAKPLENERRASFDLNTLWTGSESKSQEEDEKQVDREGSQSIERAESPDEMPGEAMDLESGDENDDVALDAILEQSGSASKAQEPVLIPEPKSEDIDDLPQVWSGEITMPLDPNITLAPKVITRQIGGRELEPYSGYWQTLFPHSQARIDGRVQTGHSTQYLVTTRLNPTKELIAVCFTPTTEEDKSKFDELINFLLSKDRHALVFPWGTHPKPQAPGRELYIVPLLRESPIPEYIELLDDLHLPRDRKSNILIGIFVLNKGKLAASTPPPPPVVSTPLNASFAPRPPNTASTPLQNVIPNLAGLASVPVPPSATSSTTNPSAPRVDPASLSAEIASLTPEQIQLLLRHLGQTAPLPPTVPAPPVIAPNMPPLPPAVTQPPYSVPPYPPYPSYQQSPPHPPMGHESPPYSAGHDHDDYPGRPYGREDRGGRGRGRGADRGRRGRGRGKPYDERDGGRYRDAGPRSYDASWVNKGRGRGQASPVDGHRNRTGE